MFNPYYPNYPNYQNYTQNYQNCTQNLERGIVRVNGIQGAQAYQMGANSSVALFDANEDFFYIKTTDGAGFASIRKFKFVPCDDAQLRDKVSSLEMDSRFCGVVRYPMSYSYSAGNSPFCGGCCGNNI